MTVLVRIIGVVIASALLAGLAYGGAGFLDALNDASDLRRRADALISEGRGGAGLGEGRAEQLLVVEDPAYEEHSGVDFVSPGAGATTVTQSLAKRLAFESFTPGVAKVRQTGYAIGLEARLTKPQIMALWLDTVEIGRGPDGWMTGFFAASEALFGRPPAELSDREFLRLVAVLIAPSRFSLQSSDRELEERVLRIERLLAGICAPDGTGDVWLVGCQR